MKALIRGKEVMTEPFSPWVQNNLAFLTGTEVDANGNPIPGDGWTLVEDYQEPVEQPAEPLPEARSDSEGGKEYTLDELKKLIE